MSKEGSNLRLLGSPVNLSNRIRRKEKTFIRNRPQSALQNSYFAPDNRVQKRPFSADTKDRMQPSKSFHNSFGSDLPYLSYDRKSIESSLTVRALSPTTELLENKANLSRNGGKERDTCSNSDYGSEDTYVSLGTQIKARAQQGLKNKPLSNKSHFLKYRSIAKKNKKAVMDRNDDDKIHSEYGMEVKITGRQASPAGHALFYDRPVSPSIRQTTFESYYLSLEDAKRPSKDDLTGRVSFGKYNINNEVADALDTYSRRLKQTKQLSLVEEESLQDLDSTPSLNLPSSSQENIENDEDAKKGTGLENSAEINTLPDNNEEEQRKKINNCRTYTSFYEDFHSLTNVMTADKCKRSSSAVHTDTSSKDSGYQDIGSNDGKGFTSSNSVQPSNLETGSAVDNNRESKSNDTIQKGKNDNKMYNTFPLDKNQWAEPTNHSRLMYKEFFLRKEGSNPLPPQNSPRARSCIDGCRGDSIEITNNTEENGDYPPYLKNSTTKAYTSKVIEDYKKELEAINSLHELTLKDIKTDTISPTPLNIDRMFEVESSQFDCKSENSSEHSEDKKTNVYNKKVDNSFDITKKDISKVSTKELIQNYLKVKEDYSREFPNKNTKSFEKKSNVTKPDLNNKTPRAFVKSPISVSVRNPTFRISQPARTPSSARLESSQHDREIESWMSIRATSPCELEIESQEIIDEVFPKELPDIVEKFDRKDEVKTVEKVEDPPVPTTSGERPKPRELTENSTVLDVYSMLKEIESYGDRPVAGTSNSDGAAVENTGQDNQGTNEERPSSVPKDNFMEIFEFLEKVEQSANDALSVVTTPTPQTIPKLEMLLKLPPTELAQRLVTASLQLEERSCCIALLQESLANHKEQMINKVSNLEKQSLRNIARVKQECEATIKRHQSFIDQLINDKKTLNHRIEQLVDERRTLEERWKRSAQALEERYKLELRNQHDKMAAAQQELTVRGLESELREMADRQQKEVSDLKMLHAETLGKLQSRHSAELDQLRRTLEQEKEEALIKERQLASARLEKQILELELTYQEQRTRLVADMRAENDRAARELSEREQALRQEIEKWREEEEKVIEQKKCEMQQELIRERGEIEQKLKLKEQELEAQYEEFKKRFEAEQQLIFKKKVMELSAQHKQERDKEIEKAIESMEAEAQAGRKELQDALRRNKEQYETELRELAETEQATLKRYQDAQARIRQTEDKLAEMEVTISHLETRNKILTEKNMQLESQGEEIKARCEESWRRTIEGLKKEMENMKKTHEEQMHQLYAKVKVAVARKDSAIQALTRESAKYQEKIAVLEQKLQQQRKDFLKQK